MRTQPRAGSPPVCLVGSGSGTCVAVLLAPLWFGLVAHLAGGFFCAVCSSRRITTRDQPSVYGLTGRGRSGYYGSMLRILRFGPQTATHASLAKGLLVTCTVRTMRAGWMADALIRGLMSMSARRHEGMVRSPSASSHTGPGAERRGWRTEGS